MIIDNQYDTWRRRYWLEPNTFPPQPFIPLVPLPSPDELAEFRRLLDRAREYDRRNNEPDCEMDDKKKRLKKMAEKLGVDISFVEEKPRQITEFCAG